MVLVSAKLSGGSISSANIWLQIVVKLGSGYNTPEHPERE